MRSEAKTLKDVVAWLKANPDKIPGGTAGIGSASHLGALAFFAATNTSFQLIPYRGTGPAMQDLVANQIQIMIDQSSNSLPQMRAGKIKGLCRDRQGAQRGRRRRSRRPPRRATRWNVSVLARSVGAQRHAGRVIARLNAAAVATLQDPDIRKRLEDLGQDLPTPARWRRPPSPPSRRSNTPDGRRSSKPPR